MELPEKMPEAECSEFRLTTPLAHCGGVRYT